MGIFENLHESIIYFSSCHHTPIYDENNCFQGKLYDFFVDYEEKYPTVLAILIKKNRSFLYADWKYIKSFSYNKIIISSPSTIKVGKTFPKIMKQKTVKNLLRVNQEYESVDYPGLSRTILDKQIVDTYGKKVVRVNDIHFIKIGRMLRATHAAVGLKSMARRLGLERYLTFLIRAILFNPKKELNEKIISWRFVHAIGDRYLGNVKLNVSNEDLGQLHPADLADIIEELDGHGRQKIFKELDKEKAADTLAEIERENLQVNLLTTKTPEDAARIIEHMGTDEAADILGEMHPENIQNIIEKIEDVEVKEDIQELLNYEEDTAGGIMSTEVFTVDQNQKKIDIIKHLENHHEDYENIYDIYITDKNETLIGTCSLRRLLASKDPIKIGDIMNTEDMKYQTHETHWKKLATFMSKYNLINIPIVDQKKKVLGFISVDDILPWLLHER